MAMIDVDHLACADQHRRNGKALLGSAAHPWGCVAIFYSAYHQVRWALLRDPRFDDWHSLREIHPRLIPDDRYSYQHQARRGATQTRFGVNDLVELLYSDIATDYISLHAASLDVRYRNATTWSSLPNETEVLAAVDNIESYTARTVLNRSPRDLP